MKPALEALKLKMKERDDKKAEGGTSKTFGDMYPFWNMKFGEEAELRALPFKGMTADDLLPFVNKLEHVLSINGEDQKIPCRKMYGADCAICALSAKYYKSEGKTSEKGKYYYRDAKALCSVYIVNDPLPVNEETKENDQGKIKVVQLGYQISNKYDSRLKALLNKGELDDLPWDLRDGLNFAIAKTKQGEFANYGTDSDFVRRSSSLPEDVIENFEPVDLSKYLPADFGAEKVQRMLDAHLTGEDYEEDNGEDGQKPEQEKEKPKADPKPESKKSEPVEESAKPKADKEETKAAEKPSEESTESEDEDAEDDYIAMLKRRSKKD